MSILDWEDLRLTPEESRGICRLKKIGKPLLTPLPSGERFGVRGGFVKHLHEKSGGWAAGLTLMLEQAKRGKLSIESLKESNSEAIFSYFAGEVFEKTDDRTKDFLLKTSFLPT